MIILIPLGGTGERFKKNNYRCPKALIKIFGKPILYYLLDNLTIDDQIEFVYIAYNKEYANYQIENILVNDYPNIRFKFFKLENNTRGALETIYLALKNINVPSTSTSTSMSTSTSILCLDADNFYTCNIIKLCQNKNCVITFQDSDNDNNNPIYSYVKVNDDGDDDDDDDDDDNNNNNNNNNNSNNNNNNQITDIKEKCKISNYACCGAYKFESTTLLMKYAQIILDKNIMQNGEFYTSGVIKEMINDGHIFNNVLINQNDWHCLGTPIQVLQFYNNFPNVSSINGKNCIEKMRICFDLDGTLVSFPRIKDDYSTVDPIQKNINFLKYLKTFGHTIIIYTARRMKTHGGNLGKILSDIGKITFDTLEKFDIPYDEIFFGKPYANYYIDDLAINSNDDLEKSIGYYMHDIKPRDFNNLIGTTIETYVKHSNDLSGEIHYYNNIPTTLKDMFPILIDYDLNNKWYKMEKIKGITVSTLYLSELLTFDTLEHICNSIIRIQNCANNGANANTDANIYDNYCKKLKSRYQSYNYSKFDNSNNVYSDLYDKLKTYEMNNNGRTCIIHGDPVMTNIIINNFGKIKFIDMRGKIDNTLTIYGDWLYDWAKLYQSLIGYDKILMGKSINENYEKQMILFFEKFFINKFSAQDFTNLKIITKSLLFTLIPLHDNYKCQQYYQLIFSIYA